MMAREENIPMSWQKFLMVVAICKAAIGGAGLALAILGAYNVAAAITAHDWIVSVQHAYTLDAFALGGGVIGAALKIFTR
ncbi:MAG TPA: hypothetical protein VIF40_07860 [Methylosinus sp.]|jgi:hypothetical protein|uniref:hypothetical protein n=1 Tax=Methylosinus sp. TaxID=427 RepID=UPI002F938C50